MIKLLLAIAFIVVCLYVGVGIFLYFAQRSMIYHPTPAIAHAFEELDFIVGTATIKVIRLNKGQGSAILYLGGNAEVVANSAFDLKTHFPEHTIYVVNYRGYGGSSGSPEEQSLYADSLHIFDKVSNLHDNIAVVGRSLGSGVATYLASNRKPAKLVLITPFDSILNVAQARFPTYPIRLVLKDTFDSYARASKITSDTLVLLAGRDAIIPKAHSDRLIQGLVNCQVKIEVIEGADHNNLAVYGEYYRYLKSFL